MKKFSAILIAALVFIALLAALSSCKESALTSNLGGSEELTLENFIEKINEKQNSAATLESHSITEINMSINGSKFSAKDSIHTISDSFNSDSEKDYYFRKSVSEITSDIPGISESTTSIEAFNEGNFFSYYKNSDGEIAIYSEETVEDFIDYMISKNSDSLEDPDLYDCVKKSLTENDDNTFTFKSSGYTSKTVGVMQALTGLNNNIGLSLVDFEVEITAEADAHIKNGRIVFIFDNTNSTHTAEASMSFSYTPFNEIKKNTDDIRPDDYEKIENALLIKNIESMIYNKCEAEEGAFNLDIIQNTAIGSEKNTQEERDEISFTNKDGIYSYDLESTIGDASYVVSYINGKQTVTANGKTSSSAQTNDEAKDFITGLMTCYGYDSNIISNIKETSENTYELTVKLPDKKTYEPLFTSIGGKLTGIEHKISVTLEDKDIKIIHSIVTVEGTAPSNTEVPLKASASVEITLEFTN